MSTALSPQKLLQPNNSASSPRRAKRLLFHNGSATCLCSLGAVHQVPAHKPGAAAASSINSTSHVAGSTQAAFRTDSCSDNCSSHARHALTAVLAATMGLSTALTAAPVGAMTSTAVAPDVEQQQSSTASLHASGVAALPLPEAPALVSDSSEVLLGSMREAVAGGLQEMAASSMTAVGGPVIGESLSAGLVSSTSSSISDHSSPSDVITSSSSDVNNINSPEASTAAASTLDQGSAAAQALQPAAGMSLGHRAVLCSLWQRYCRALETSPLLTKVYTGVAGTMLGDLAAQLLSYSQSSAAPSLKSSSSSSSRRSSRRASKGNSGSSPKPGFQFDVLRCGRLCLYSAAIGTPMGHYWYEVLEALVMPASPTAPAAVAAKVALDQLLQTPFGMALFFAVMKMMEGRPREVPQELRSKLMPGLLANWKLWPAAQLVNFTVIPPEQRILFGNIVGVCWTCVISNMQQSSSGEAAAEATTAGSGSKADAEAASGAAKTGAVDGRTLRRTSTPMPA